MIHSEILIAPAAGKLPVAPSPLPPDMPPKIRPHDPQVRGAGLSGQASVGFRRTWSVLTTLAAGVARGDAPPTVVSYYDDIKPLFAVHCLKCHGPEKHEAGLRLDVREHALKGGESGVAILTGKAAESELIRRISSHDHDEQMPPKGLRLTTAEIADLSHWIDGGARWPDRDDYWAFQPLPREVPIPEGSASNPIDRFLSDRKSVV